jgi:type I restriction enzyme R subunit
MFQRELGAAWEQHPAYANREDDRISAMVDLTQQVFNVVERELSLTGFWESVPARNRLKAELQKTLLQPKFVKLPSIVPSRVHLISRVMEIAEKNNDVILYAE